jgi:hypothetical protein
MSKKKRNKNVSIVLVVKSESEDFQNSVNRMISEGYQPIWSTYRHPKQDSFSIVLEVVPRRKKFDKKE